MPVIKEWIGDYKIVVDQGFLGEELLKECLLNNFQNVLSAGLRGMS
jgi:hypothetical protein